MNGGITKNLTQGPLGSMYFYGETSAWSDTQTFTISYGASTENSPTTPHPSSSTPTPTSPIDPTGTPELSPTPTFPETNLAVAVLVIATVTVGCIVVFRRKSALTSKCSLS
ncbi:MAG: hypothetical protein ACBZ72_07340 [Candidatus Bathyarchaeia archaeon]|jgi:hypothetical protein